MTAKNFFNILDPSFCTFFAVYGLPDPSGRDHDTKESLK
jgi:hypothetical protein